MSKVLVIPDTHLKPKMFDLADKILRENKIDYVVQLGDNFDDFYCREEQYRVHNVRMLRFLRDHPKTVWLFGNHEISYLLDRPVTGNIFAGQKYAKLYAEKFHPKFVHSDGKVIFSHAGIFREFLTAEGLAAKIPEFYGDDKVATSEIDSPAVAKLIEKINALEPIDLWCNDSPLWARP